MVFVFHNGFKRIVMFCQTAIIITVAFMLSSPAEAVMVECQGASTESGYKVLLDELSYTNASFESDRDLQEFMGRLKFKLRNKMKSLELEDRLKVIPCFGRRPLDESEFTMHLVDALNTRSVVLEIWGALSARISDGQVHGREARIVYVVVPLRHYEKGAFDGIYSIQYPRNQSLPAGEFIDMFDQATEINAYAAIGIGIRSLKAKNYDMALQQMCKAGILLSQAWGNASGRDPEEKALFEYVKRSASQAAEAARKDADYKGAIRILPDRSDPCPVGGP